jgi:hypothetical protein
MGAEGVMIEGGACTSLKGWWHQVDSGGEFGVV